MGEDSIGFEVADNGKGMASNTAAALQETLDTADQWDYEDYRLKGVALPNIQKRIRAKYGAGYGLSIRSSPGNGFCVSVRLPLLKDSFA